MAIEFLKRELSVLHSQEAARVEGCWLETSEPRTNYLAQQCILEELSSVVANRELSLPENLGKDTCDLDGAYRSEGPFGMDDGCSVSDQGRDQNDGVVMELSNALIARSKRWQERIPQLASGRLACGPGPRSNAALGTETEALQATLQATQAHLTLIGRMKTVIEEGILQKQDKIDGTEFMVACSRAKATLLKLRSLEWHFLSATYKAEDIIALSKIYEELTGSIQQHRTQFTEAQQRLAVFRGLGPAFHEQLKQFRDVQRRLLDAQYMLENFNKINSELEDGAADMMDGAHMAHLDDGGYVIY